MRINTIHIALMAMFFFAGSVSCQELWVGKDGGIKSANAIGFISDEKGYYFATKDGLYKSAIESDASRWEPVYTAGSGENEIRAICIVSGDLFVGTKRGLYRSRDGGASWQAVFKSINDEKSSILSVASTKDQPYVIIIGTETGVFTSENGGNGWLDISGGVRGSAADRVIAANRNIYVCGNKGIYIKRPGMADWERIYINKGRSMPPDEHEAAEENETAEESSDVFAGSISVSGTRIYASVRRYIIYSDDDGRSWKDFPSQGIAGNINSIAIDETDGRIFAATAKGIFQCDREGSFWKEIYVGSGRSLFANGLFLDKAGTGRVWASTDKGLFRLEPDISNGGKKADIDMVMHEFNLIADREPRFWMIRQAALKYAELDPEKIARWRSESRLKALLPRLSVNIDNDSSSNSEIYTSATRDYVVMGPDEVSRGFGVSLSWDLADMVWSDDQTNIDVRSRLTTQLRNDVLDDLRRIYFERRRVQFELINNPPETDKARFEKEIRLQELTEAIDDLTGDYFSEQLSRVNG